LAIAWVLANPAVDVAIVGARHPKQLTDTAQAEKKMLSRSVLIFRSKLTWTQIHVQILPSWTVADCDLRLTEQRKNLTKKSQSPANGKNLAKCLFDRFSTFGPARNPLKRDMNKAPQVGLEPTTLWLTEGFHVVARRCGLLLTHSSFCIYRVCRFAEMRSSLLGFARCCAFKKANKRQGFAIFTEHCGGAVSIPCSKILLWRALGLPQYLRVTS